mgnify:CR=1 FL=1
MLILGLPRKAINRRWDRLAPPHDRSPDPEIGSERAGGPRELLSDKSKTDQRGRSAGIGDE